MAVQRQKKYYDLSVFIIFLLGLNFQYACNPYSSSSSSKIVKEVPSSDSEGTPGLTIDQKSLFNAKDPICHMPLKHYLHDTLHYKGRIYGFCAPSCKQAFALNPKHYEDEH